MKSMIPLAILAAPLVATGTATILYVVGGFGGGHGPYDFWIYCLGLPSVLISEGIATYNLNWMWDPGWLIVLPGLANFLVFALIAAITHGLLQDRKTVVRQSESV